MRNIYSALVQFVYPLCSWWWIIPNIMLTQSIKAYSHAKSLIKSYHRASKAESFCDWDGWSTAYLRLLQIYIYIFDFSGEQPSTKRLQGSRFPSLFTNNFMIYTPKRNACVGQVGAIGSSNAILPTPRNPSGLLLLLIATLTPEVAPFCPFLAMIERKPSSRQKSSRIPWELGCSEVYSLCT